MSQYMESPEFQRAQKLSAEAQVNTIKQNVLRLQAQLDKKMLALREAKNKSILNQSGIDSEEAAIEDLKNQIQTKQDEIDNIKSRFSI